jgi:integrase
MPIEEGTLLTLTGGVHVKARVQHPEIHTDTTKKRNYFFRYWTDEIQPDRSLKPIRKKHICGPSKGDDKISYKQAELIRDEEMKKHNAVTVQAAMAKGQALFGEIAKMYLDSHVDRRGKLKLPSRDTERFRLESYILPQWEKYRLAEITPKEVEDWLFSLKREDGEPFAWWTMKGIRKTMSAVYHKAETWGYWEEGKRNPLVKVDIGQKSYRNARKILSWGETAAVLARMEDPNRLVLEVCIATSTRISEATGLMIKHFDPAARTIRIEQRNYHNNIDTPKTKDSRRILAVGDLSDRVLDWIAKLDRRGPEDWLFPQSSDPSKPLWDSGVRKALHEAAQDVGCDFAGLGPHSFRRANITWRQEVGGSAIEASKIAGHSELGITADYTFVAIARQEALTKAIQERLAKAAPKDDGPGTSDRQREHLARARRAKKEKQQATVIEITRQESAA